MRFNNLNKEFESRFTFKLVGIASNPYFFFLLHISSQIHFSFPPYFQSNPYLLLLLHIFSQIQISFSSSIFSVKSIFLLLLLHISSQIQISFSSSIFWVTSIFLGPPYFQSNPHFLFLLHILSQIQSSCSYSNTALSILRDTYTFPNVIISSPHQYISPLIDWTRSNRKSKWTARRGWKWGERNKYKLSEAAESSARGSPVESSAP